MSSNLFKQYWRRRFFRLNGLNLTAFHETTRQPRAKISLARATKLIDDKSTLMQPDGTPKPGKGRRKSAFAEEDQAYMFVEEGFRIRFANGEAIDFYADSAAEKDGWMAALSGVVGKDAVASGKSWCQMVLRREKILKERAEQVGKARPRSQGQAMLPHSQHNSIGMKSTPSSPVKGRNLNMQDAVPRPMSQRDGPPAGRLGSRRNQIKSMIF